MGRLIINTNFKETGKKISQTKNDSEWKETVGKEAAIKQSETKNDPRWKATVGKESRKKGAANTDYKRAAMKQSKTVNDPEWKVKNLKTCEHCGKKDLRPGMYKRWHHNNCKFKEN